MKLEIKAEIHVHSHDEQQLRHWMGSIDHKISQVHTQLSALGASIMAQFSDIQALLPALNEATNKIATEVQALIDQLKAQPTQEQIDGVVNGLTAIKDNLTAIGANAENPLPTT